MVGDLTLKQMLARLDWLDRKASILDRRTKQAKAIAAQYEYEVHKRMEAEGFDIGDAVVHAGTRWSRRFDYYAKVQDPLEFYAWAEEHAPHLIQPKERKAKLNELVQQAMEDNTPLPPGLGAVPKPWISRTST